jgi:hypothetical protein
MPWTMKFTGCHVLFAKEPRGEAFCLDEYGHQHIGPGNLLPPLAAKEDDGWRFACHSQRTSAPFQTPGQIDRRDQRVAL